MFPFQPYKKSTSFTMIHKGPCKVKTIPEKCWFISFIDQSRMTWLFLLKDQSDIGIIFQKFVQNGSD